MSVIGSKGQREKLATKLSTFGHTPCQQVHNLCLIFDSDLNFKAHVGYVTKTAFYHLRNIAEVQMFLSLSNTERLMHVCISSKLAY